MMLGLAMGGCWGWSSPELIPKCVFKCCSCCEEIRCECGLDGPTPPCKAAAWDDPKTAYARTGEIRATAFAVVFAASLLGVLLVLFAIIRDLAELPRRTRITNPIGHSEGSLCLLHAYQEPPPGTRLFLGPDAGPATATGPTLRVPTTPVSLVNLGPVCGPTDWLSAAPVAPSPLLHVRLFRPGAAARPIPAKDRPPPPPPDFLFRPTLLFVVKGDVNDRRSILADKEEEG